MQNDNEIVGDTQDEDFFQILLLEDDPDLRSSLSDILSDSGYHVTAVTDGLEAVELSSKQNFDLIITDIKMPGKDGLTAIEEMRVDQPDVAGIVITGYSTEEYASKAAGLRLSNYLKKPFSLSQLVEAVDEVAREKAAQAKFIRAETSIHRSLLQALSQFFAHLEGMEIDEIADQFSNWEQQYLLNFTEPRRSVVANAVWIQLLRDLAGFELKTYDSQLTFLQSAELRAQLEEFTDSLLAHLNGEVLEKEVVGVEQDRSSNNLLAMGLHFENFGALRESENAYRLFLEKNVTPSGTQKAHFGLARLAFIRGDFPLIEENLRKGLRGVELLGVDARAEAHLEAGILLARTGSGSARELLQRTAQLSTQSKNGVLFGLSSFALSHFFGEPTSKVAAIISTLLRADNFIATTTHADWLLLFLARQSDKSERVLSFLHKLVRAAPEAFFRLLINETSQEIVAALLPFVKYLAEEKQKRIEARIQSLGDADLVDHLRKAQQESPLEGRDLVRIYSFSGLRMFYNDEPISLKRRKPLLLFLYLLAYGRPVPEGKLLEDFWPGPEAKAQASLRTSMSFLKKLFNYSRQENLFERSGNTIRIVPKFDIWFDLQEFRKRITQSQKGEANARLGALQEAVRLHQGAFLESVYEDWALAIRDATQVQYQEALRHLVRAAEARADWNQVFEFAGKALHDDPLSQEAAISYTRACVELKRPTEALQVIANYERQAAEELGLELPMELIRLKEMAKMNV